MDLLSAGAKANIKGVFQNLADTFQQTPITIKLRKTTTAKKFGEGYTPAYDDISIKARVESSKASGERYINVDDTPKGKDFSEGVRVFIWKDYLDAKLGVKTINPETDRVELDGLVYEIRMFTVSNRFGTIGPMQYEMDLTAIVRENS